MVMSRKDGEDINHKCWMKLTERATMYVRAKTEGEVSPISIEEIRKQLAVRWRWIRYVIRPASYWSMIKDERTRECMSREEMDGVLTSVIPYSWRLSELTPLFKGKRIILEWSNFCKNEANSHIVKLWADNKPHAKNYCTVGVFGRGRSTVDPVVDRPLLNTKWVLPNSTIVLIACGLLSAQIASRCGTLALFFKSYFTPVWYLFH